MEVIPNQVSPYGLEDVIALSNVQTSVQGHKKHAQENLTGPEEHSNFPMTDPKEMEIYKFPVKELKLTILKKLSKIQENTNRQLNKIRKIVH